MGVDLQAPLGPGSGGLVPLTEADDCGTPEEPNLKFQPQNLIVHPRNLIIRRAEWGSREGVGGGRVNE